MLDNRELAALIWLGIAFLWALSQKNIRSGIGGALRIFFSPIIFLPLLLMFGYIALEVWIGWKLGLWNPGLLKGTIIWAVGSAAVLFFKAPDAAKDPHFFRNTVAATLGVAVFVEFFMNIGVMSLAAELLLQPAAALRGRVEYPPAQPVRR